MEAIKNAIAGLNFDFVGKRRIAGILSLILVSLSWVIFVVVGPNWGIDFEGGTEIRIGFEERVDISEVRGALKRLGLAEDAVQTLGTAEESRFQIRIKEAGFGMAEVQQEVESTLRARFGEDWIERVQASVEVGARFTVKHKPAPEGAAIPLADISEALQSIEGVSVAEGRDEDEVIVTVPGLAQAIERSIQAEMGDRKMQVLSVESVGPKVGADLAEQGAIAVVATLALVLLYVGFRFDIGFAPGAILALFHDVSVTVGVFVLLGREFNLPLIGALLTIVGYSLNDTIVIYDRIRENMERYRRNDLAALINTSVNETLTRTIATSATTLLAISPFLLLGGSVIQDFALAMTIGIFVGTYSTVYVASPMILVMEDLKPMLGRFIVSAPTEAAPESADAGPLTESEKRRRERAEREAAERAQHG